MAGRSGATPRADRRAPVDTHHPRTYGSGLMRARLLGLLVLAALLPALVALTPLAYASPPDPVWISGFFDDGDHDDVVVLVTSAGGAIDPFPLQGAWTASAPADRLGPGEPPSLLARLAAYSSTPRAP